MRRTFFARSGRAGFTLIEAMTAMAIVALACGATLLATGGSLQATKSSTTMTRAILLAQELMNEISAMHWADPNEPRHWGPESAETSTKSRSDFDDLDDYDGWTGPPQTRSGVLYDSLQQKLFPVVTTHEYSAYTCSVHVRYVSADGKVLPVGETSAFRQVTVEVAHEGEPTQKLSQVFQDYSHLFGSQHWFKPNPSQPLATVQIVP